MPRDTPDRPDDSDKADKPDPGDVVTAADYLPERRTLGAARAAAAICHGCDLYLKATRTVFGEGGTDARFMFVGEQPGDVEDRVGRPFVGPAGRVFDCCLADAGIDRAEAFVTNAVKHFRWTPSGKRRLHARPSARQIEHCKPWLELELELIKPRALMALGSIAAKALFGRHFLVSEQRGVRLESKLAPIVMATVHPSALLRAPDSATRERETARFIADLRALVAAVEDLAA